MIKNISFKLSHKGSPHTVCAGYQTNNFRFSIVEIIIIISITRHPPLNILVPLVCPNNFQIGKSTCTSLIFSNLQDATIKLFSFVHLFCYTLHLNKKLVYFVATFYLKNSGYELLLSSHLTVT